MEQALAQLDIAAQIAEHNRAYSLEQGDQAQAQLQAEVAQECREAINQLAPPAQ